MLDFFQYGELLLSAISSIGDFLLLNGIPIPPEAVDNLVSWLSSLGFYEVANWVSSAFYPGVSLAALLFGSGVIIFLTIRLVKFFTDLVL